MIIRVCDAVVSHAEEPQAPEAYKCCIVSHVCNMS